MPIKYFIFKFILNPLLIGFVLLNLSIIFVLRVFFYMPLGVIFKVESEELSLWTTRFWDSVLYEWRKKIEAIE